MQPYKSLLLCLIILLIHHSLYRAKKKKQAPRYNTFIVNRGKPYETIYKPYIYPPPGMHTDHALKEALRVNRATFLKLLKMLTDNGFNGIGQVTPEECLCIFLSKMAQGFTYTTLRRDFQRNVKLIYRAISAITKIFYKTLYLGYVLNNPISWHDARDIYLCRTRDPELVRCFEDVVGAVDGTHIHAYFNHTDLRKIDRHGDYSLNVVLVIDMVGQFRYVGFASGSCHDSTIFKLLCPKWRLPEGGYLLGDHGFAYSSSVLTPYKKVRYHLSEWSYYSDKRPKNRKEMFNKKHSSMRMLVEMTIGHLKSSWKVLDKARMLYPDNLVPILCVLLGLHNFIKQEEKNFNVDDDLDEFVARRMAQIDAGVFQEEPEPILLEEVINDRRERISSHLWRVYQRMLGRRRRD